MPGSPSEPGRERSDRWRELSLGDRKGQGRSGDQDAILARAAHLPVRPPSCRHHFARTRPPWRSVLARDNVRVADEVRELVQDQPGIRDRPGIPGMTRKRKPIGGLESQSSPKRAMEEPQVSALRSPSQARTGLAQWSLIVDKPPDDQAAQVEVAPRPRTARAPIKDREPAPPRQRTPDDWDLKDAYVRDGQLDGRPLLGGLHAKNAGQRVVKRRGPEDKVRPAARISQRPGRWESGQARDILNVDPVRPLEAAVVTLLLVPLPIHSPWSRFQRNSHSGGLPRNSARSFRRNRQRFLMRRPPSSPRWTYSRTVRGRRRLPECSP